MPSRFHLLIFRTPTHKLNSFSLCLLSLFLLYLYLYPHTSHCMLSLLQAAIMRGRQAVASSLQQVPQALEQLQTHVLCKEEEMDRSALHVLVRLPCCPVSLLVFVFVCDCIMYSCGPPQAQTTCSSALMLHTACMHPSVPWHIGWI